MVATESTPQSPPRTELSSPSTASSSHIDDIGRSPCLRSSPSSDNLKGYVTPSGTWDGRSIQALPELNSLQSSGSSSTYLISRHLDGNETPLSADSGTSTDTSDGKQPIRSLCHVLHEKTTHPEPPYHVFPQKKKKTLMYIAATTSMFSSLSANIYFPALGQISRDINVGLPLLSLTVTVYMVAQALAPSFWGPLSDARGRRITFIGTFITYLGASLALALTTGFVPLLILRGLQAAGSAATISIGQGLIADIATPSERGSFTGTNQGIRMLGQAIGPVFGGIISQYLGYHVIFWFLFGGGVFALLVLVVFLPETLRPIAGNGSICLKGIHRPLYYRFTPSQEHLIEQNLPPAKPFTPSMLLNPFKLLLEKDVFSTILFGSVVYAVWSMVTSSTPALFQSRFHLSDLQTGLIFLPNGIASILGSYLTGKLSAHDLAVVNRRSPSHHPADFPFAHARLRSIWWLIALLLLSTALYGFSLRLHTPFPALLLQFLISYAANSIFALNSTLMVDLFPGSSASATALNNLVRCLLGAGGVAGVQVVIDALGAGPTFALCAGVMAAAGPLVALEWRNGARWARERRERLAAAG